jgi:hypothetical protein
VCDHHRILFLFLWQSGKHTFTPLKSSTTSDKQVYISPQTTRAFIMKKIEVAKMVGLLLSVHAHPQQCDTSLHRAATSTMRGIARTCAKLRTHVI